MDVKGKVIKAFQDRLDRNTDLEKRYQKEVSTWSSKLESCNEDSLEIRTVLDSLDRIGPLHFGGVPSCINSHEQITDKETETQILRDKNIAKLQNAIEKIQQEKFAKRRREIRDYLIEDESFIRSDSISSGEILESIDEIVRKYD